MNKKQEKRRTSNRKTTKTHDYHFLKQVKPKKRQKNEEQKVGEQLLADQPLDFTDKWAMKHAMDPSF